MTRRLLPFGVVATLGFFVQVGVMAMLTRRGWPASLVTIVGVECAVIHNFAWHELWTWRDRVRDGSRLGRLVAFHAANGLTSIVCNVLVVELLATVTTLSLVLRTLVAVLVTGLLNFVMADRVVFATGAERSSLRIPFSRRLARMTTMLAVSFFIASAAFAGPPVQAVADWNRVIAQTESMIAGSPWRLPEFDRRIVTRGGMDIRRLEPTAEIENATLQHWRGAVLLRGARLHDVLERLTTSLPDQPDVTAARFLSRPGDRMRVYLRVVRSAIVTVTYDTEHDVEFQRLSPRLALSRSVMTRVREVSHAGDPDERVLQPGEDRGFLWRLNAYWWYEETPEGVIAVVDTLTLGRSIPALLRPVADPLVRRVAAESVTSALFGLRSRFVRDS